MSATTPEGIELEEKRRAKIQFEAIRAKRAGRIREKTGPQRSRRGTKRYSTMTLYAVRGYSTPAAIGDAIRKHILRKTWKEILDSEDPCVVLVKDGKLTPEGIARGIKL